MEEPESRARRGREEPGGRGVEIAGNTAGIPTMYDDIDDVDFDPAEFHIEEGMVAEVMKRLEEEINQPCSGSGGDLQYQVAPPSLPSPSSATPFVTINGNEESCGPSFSDSASTVMASIDTCGAVGLPQLAPVCKAAGAEEIWPWSGGVDAAADDDFGVDDIEVACDDGWLARVLAGAGLEGDGEERLGG